MDDEKLKESGPAPDAAEPGHDPDVWSRDIENRDYYYDDSTGYEVYRPEDDDDGDEDDETAG